MSLILSKILPLLVYPVSLTLFLAGLAGWLWWRKWHRLAGFTIVLANLVLWVSSTPAVGEYLYGSLERQFPPLAMANIPVADAIILLGGAVAQPIPPRLAADLNDAIDRVAYTVRLYRAGKGTRIVIAAGNLPWGKTLQPEADLIADLLVEWGIPRSAMLLDRKSRNTVENAVNAQAIMALHDLRNGLLVTSAGHMPRAVALFQAVGLEVIPCPTDFRAVGERQDTVFNWLPDVSALELTTLAIKERLGLWVSKRTAYPLKR